MIMPAIFSLFLRYWLYAFLHLPIAPHHQSVKKIQLSGFAQGTTWHITYYAEDSIVRKKSVDSILAVLDSSMSIYKPYSLISKFNRAKKNIVLDAHFEKVIAKSLEVWKASDGLFDITVMPLVEAWGFGAKKVNRYPDAAKVKSLLKCIGSGKLQLKKHCLIKKAPCISIDVNGIAQGYSVDVIAAFLEDRHIQNYLVEIGGEIRIKGRKQPGNEKMKIGIEAPGDYTVDMPVIQKIIALDSGGITTSGNYRQYHKSNGKKFSHNIDPRTGYPIQNELISVTVYAADAMTADAYDNVLMAMGLEKGMRFVEERKDLAAYFIYKKNDGSIADSASIAFKCLIKS